MSNQWPTPLFVSDGGGSNAFSAAVPCGLPEFISPIPASTKGYIFTQKMMQFLASFAPLALNTVHPSSGLTPDYSSYFLVAEEKRRDLTQGVVEWERRYATKPDSHDEWETFAYNFIGYMGSVWEIVGGNPAFGGNVATSGGAFTPFSGVFGSPLGWRLGRPRLTRSVDTRVKHDYFIIGPNPGAPIITPDYSSAGLIPQFFQFLYKNNGGLPALNQGLYTDYLVDPVAAIVGTVPTLSDYLIWVANAQNPMHGWNGDIVGNWTGAWISGQAYVVGDQVSDMSVHYQCIANVTSATHPTADPSHWAVKNFSQLVAEDSRISRWQGNLYLRQTRYVLPA